MQISMLWILSANIKNYCKFWLIRELSQITFYFLAFFDHVPTLVCLQFYCSKTIPKPSLNANIICESSLRSKILTYQSGKELIDFESMIWKHHNPSNATTHAKKSIRHLFALTKVKEIDQIFQMLLLKRRKEFWTLSKNESKVYKSRADSKKRPEIYKLPIPGKVNCLGSGALQMFTTRLRSSNCLDYNLENLSVSCFQVFGALVGHCSRDYSKAG